MSSSEDDISSRRNAVLNYLYRSTSPAAPRKKKWLWTSDLAERYNRSPRQIKRWQKAGKLPAPHLMPNGRLANTEDEIEQHERNLVGGEAT